MEYSRKGPKQVASPLWQIVNHPFSLISSEHAYNLVMSQFVMQVEYLQRTEDNIHTNYKPTICFICSFSNV